MAKKHKARTPNLPAAALVRPRLDSMWRTPEWLNTHEAQQLDELDALARGLAPAQYLPVMLKALSAMEPAIQEDIASVLVTWLRRRDDISHLKAMLEDGLFDAASTAMAQQLLDRAGEVVNLTAQVTVEQFYAAAEGVDQFGSQGMFYVAWRADGKRSRVRGCYFLVDYNPPWEGALKDIMWYTWRDPEGDQRKFLGTWTGRVAAWTELDAVEAKRRFIGHALVNRATGISLHSDIIASRDEILAHILGLPDGPDTPLFSAGDFDSLAALAQSSEQISRFEHTVGRRVRMEDGKEVFVHAGVANNPEDW